MRRLAPILSFVFALTVGGTASASSILYYNDLSVGTDRMASALAAVSGTHTVTTATSTADFATQLGAGGFDLAIFFQQNSAGAGYDAAFAALSTHIAAGGAAIANDWTRNAAHALPFQAAFTGGTNELQFTVTDASLASGLTNPVNLYDPGWGVYSTGLSGVSAALFPSLDAAIVLGYGGRTIFNGFLSDTFVDGAEGTQLFINEIDYSLSQVPEPAGVLLIGLGAIATLRRTRRAC